MRGVVRDAVGLADAVRGASQWRRALSECGAVRGTAAIRGALTAALDTIDPEEDAWRHAAACLAEPGVLLGLALLLLPGVEPAGNGGLEPLADGAVLAPALPPRDGADAWGPRAMNVAGLAVGAGRVHLEVREDPDGVQVEVAHAGGGPVRLAVALPEPDDRAVRVVYVDWLRQDETSGPFPLELRAGDEPRVVFGRTAPRDTPWTRELPALLPEGIRRAGMRLDVAGLDAPARAELQGLDAALAALLDVPVEVVESRAGEPFAGVRLRLEPDSWRQERNAIVSATERFVLRPPGPGEGR